MKIETTFKLSDGTKVFLNTVDMMNISQTYAIMCTQEYLMENHPDMSEKEAELIAAEVRRQMDKYGYSEDLAIKEVLKEQNK